MDNLKLETVSPTLYIYQKNGVFSYGTDAVLLSKYVLGFYNSMNGKRMCDLCSGTGIIPLLLCDNNPHIQTFGVEINADACEIATRSAKISKYDHRYTQICGDIKCVRDYFASESFDFLTCNPPYMTSNSGYLCDDDYKTIARHEVLCNIDDVFKAAFYLLKTGGSIFIVYRSDRLSSLFKAAANNRFEVKEMTSVVSENIPAFSKLVICRAMKDAAEGLKLTVSSVEQCLSGVSYAK